MDYLSFRHSSTEYKVPIDYNDKVKRVDPDDIEKRLESDGDAIFLSGGLDSSLLAAINKPKKAYVAWFPGEEDETHRALDASSRLGIDLQLVRITRDLYLSTLERLIERKGDGLHPNEPCLYLMAKQAEKDGCKKIISGDGADGLFGGYTKLLTGDFMNSEEKFRERYFQMDTGVEIPFEKWQEWGMYRFLLEVHTPALIDRAINACDAADVDVVFPYLENGIPQLMWEAPTGQKIDKPVLKEIAIDYLPKSVIYREKIGFPTPWDAKEFLLLNEEIGW